MNATSSKQCSLAARPPQSPTGMLCKSVVCVALVVGLAWIGFSARLAGGEATDPSVNANGAAAGTVVTGDRASVHRREVFEERRARFERRGSAQVAQVRETPDR